MAPHQLHRTGEVRCCLQGKGKPAIVSRTMAWKERTPFPLNPWLQKRWGIGIWQGNRVPEFQWPNQGGGRELAPSFSDPSFGHLREGSICKLYLTSCCKCGWQDGSGLQRGFPHPASSPRLHRQSAKAPGIRPAPSWIPATQRSCTRSAISKLCITRSELL